MQEFAKSCAKRVLTCLHASPINVPMGLHVLPKACQLLIFTCQRANKLTNVSTWCLNVPNDVPIFQLDMPTCQKACQFFEHSSYEMLKEISILYYYRKILYYT